MLISALLPNLNLLLFVSLCGKIKNLFITLTCSSLDPCLLGFQQKKTYFYKKLNTTLVMAVEF